MHSNSSLSQLAEKLEKSEAGRKKLRQAISILQDKLNATEKVLEINDNLRQECERERQQVEDAKKKVEEERRLRLILEKDSVAVKDQLAKVLQRLGAVEARQKADKKEADRLQAEVKVAVEGMHAASKAVDVLQLSLQDLENGLFEKVNAAVENSCSAFQAATTERVQKAIVSMESSTLEKVNAALDKSIVASQVASAVQSSLQNLESTVAKKVLSSQHPPGHSFSRVKYLAEDTVDNITRLFFKEKKSHMKIEHELSSLKRLLRQGANDELISTSSAAVSSGGWLCKEREKLSESGFDACIDDSHPVYSKARKRKKSTHLGNADNHTAFKTRKLREMNYKAEDVAKENGSACEVPCLERGTNFSGSTLAVHVTEDSSEDEPDTYNHFYDCKIENDKWFPGKRLLSPNLPYVSSPLCPLIDDVFLPAEIDGGSVDKVCSHDQSMQYVGESISKEVHHGLHMHCQSLLDELEGDEIISGSQGAKLKFQCDEKPFLSQVRLVLDSDEDDTGRKVGDTVDIFDPYSSLKKSEDGSSKCTDLDVINSLSLDATNLSSLGKVEGSERMVDKPGDKLRLESLENWPEPVHNHTGHGKEKRSEVHDGAEQVVHLDRNGTLAAHESLVSAGQLADKRAETGASRWLVAESGTCNFVEQNGDDHVCGNFGLEDVGSIDVEEVMKFLEALPAMKSSVNEVPDALCKQQRSEVVCGEPVLLNRSTDSLQVSKDANISSCYKEALTTVFLLQGFDLDEVGGRDNVTAAGVIALASRHSLSTQSSGKESCYLPETLASPDFYMKIPVWYTACGFISGLVDVVKSYDEGLNHVNLTTLVDAFVSLVRSVFKEVYIPVLDAIFAQLGKFLFEGKYMLIALCGIDGESPGFADVSFEGQIMMMTCNTVLATLKDVSAGSKVLAALCQVLSCVSHLQNVVYELLGWCDKDTLWLLTVFSSFASICGHMSFTMGADDLVGYGICAIIGELVDTADKQGDIRERWEILKGIIDPQGKCKLDILLGLVLSALAHLVSHDSLLLRSSTCLGDILAIDGNIFNETAEAENGTPLKYKDVNLSKVLNVECWRRKYAEVIGVLDLIAACMDWHWTYNHLLVGHFWQMVDSGSSQVMVAVVCHIFGLLASQANEREDSMTLGLKDVREGLAFITAMSEKFHPIVQEAAAFAVWQLDHRGSYGNGFMEFMKERKRGC